jgi:hypothetical protein
LITSGCTATENATRPELTVVRIKSNSPGSLSRPERCTSLTRPLSGPPSWTLTITAPTGNTFTVAKSSAGVLTYTCTVPAGNDRGGCPGSGNWN